MDSKLHGRKKGGRVSNLKRQSKPDTQALPRIYTCSQRK